MVAAALAERVPGDWPPRAIEIASDPGGAPYASVAPGAGAVAGFAPGERLPVSVSISHAEAHALCAAAWDEGSDGSRRMVGIDLCAIEPRSPELVATFFVDDERRYVRDAPPWERDARANLVWCAKEAVLKAFGVGLTVDTYALCCLPAPGVADPAEWPLAPADHRWRPFVAACAPPLAPEGEQVRGIWRAFGAFVAALATVRRRDTPAAAGHGPRA